MNWKNLNRPIKSYAEMRLLFLTCWLIMHFIMSMAVIFTGDLEDLLPVNSVVIIICAFMYFILPKHMWKQIEKERNR